MRRDLYSYIIVAIVFATALLLSPKQTRLLQIALTNFSPTISVAPESSWSASSAKVSRVIDGDTIELETGETLRYIGIDTPETKHPSKPVQCYGEEAYRANKNLVEGKVVRIEKDVSEVDRYKRLLRYVYVATEASPSGILANDYLVRNGYAFVSTFPPDVKFSEQFIEAQREARQKNLGAWANCPIDSN